MCVYPFSLFSPPPTSRFFSLQSELTLHLINIICDWYFSFYRARITAAVLRLSIISALFLCSGHSILAVSRAAYKVRHVLFALDILLRKVCGVVLVLAFMIPSTSRGSCFTHNKNAILGWGCGGWGIKRQSRFLTITYFHIGHRHQMIFFWSLSPSPFALNAVIINNLIHHLRYRQ